MIKNPQRIVGYWLLTGVIMLMIQVLLGGITRLTGSGLSITEWKPLLGALPPVNQAEWEALFSKYREIAQFKFLNQDFTMSDFKVIYFWEWFHRNWARFIAVVFLIPFAFFIYKKMITREMLPKLLGLFLLGIGQGLIGWIMVKSGLNDENLYVSHIRLAAHFVSAMVLIAFTGWFAWSVLLKNQIGVKSGTLRSLSLGLLLLLFFQLVYGAFMAGLKAATIAPTWPDINGDWIPSGLWSNSFIHHPINIHFVHRLLAYLLLAGILFWYVKARTIRYSPHFNRYKIWPLLLVAVQLLLGIVTVLVSPKQARNSLGLFEVLASAHQVVAMCLFMSLVWSLYLSYHKSESI